jgi:hypothetical protein
MPTSPDDNLLPFSLPSLRGKKITAGFDGGNLSSDGGVLLLAKIDRQLGLTGALARAFGDRRKSCLIRHQLTDIIRARVFAIACGYEDGNDLDTLRRDSAFKIACGHLPETDPNLAAQPTISRMENAPGIRDLVRMQHVMIDLWCRGYRTPPAQVILDIDDTADVVHGHQQMALFNAFHDERCFLPVHVYDAATGHCLLAQLRPGKTPNGKEVAGHIRRLVHRIRRHWPGTVIVFRGDSHYGRIEAMQQCDRLANVRYIFGLGPNEVLKEMVFPDLDRVCVARAIEQSPKVRGFGDMQYAAKSWKTGTRRVIARIEATTRGADVRYVATNLEGEPAHLYEKVYCARGQAENCIKRHKGQLASDRTSCRSPLANQMRLVLHSAAYWLMRLLCAAVPKNTALATADFDSVRLRLLKVAVRVREVPSRIRLAFAANCPFKGMLRWLLVRPLPAPA